MDERLFLEALSAGVPLVALPVTNEQPGIAARVAWVGAGEAITLSRASPERLCALITRVRADPSYRVAAERARDAIQGAGGAPRAAELVEQHLGVGAGFQRSVIE